MPTFAYDLPSIDGQFSVDRRPTSQRLNAGLSSIFKDDEPALTAGYTLPPDDSNWDKERLNPSTCNLRSVVLVSNGIPTGEKSIAQITALPRI